MVVAHLQSVLAVLLLVAGVGLVFPCGAEAQVQLVTVLAHLQSVLAVLLLVAGVGLVFPCGAEAQVQLVTVVAHLQSVAAVVLPLAVGMLQAFQRGAVVQA